MFNCLRQKCCSNAAVVEVAKQLVGIKSFELRSTMFQCFFYLLTLSEYVYTRCIVMFWQRCVCSVFSKSIKCVMKYEVEIKEDQNVKEASLLFGHFSNVTFQLSKDLKRGRGKVPLFSPFYICLGKVSRFYIFFKFRCNIHFSWY